MEDGDIYVTDLREPLSRSPQDRTFFARLDAELTKVNKFYKKKEAENISRAGDLEKQMLELINAEEAIARQNLPDFESHLDYMHKDKGAHVARDHLPSKRDNESNVYISIPMLRYLKN